MHLGFGIDIMDLTHHFGITDVAVPSHRIGVLTKFRVLQCAYGTTPQIVVMVQHPDLSWYAAALQKRPQVFAYKFNLGFLRPDASWHPAILVSIYFVLRG